MTIKQSTEFNVSIPFKSTTIGLVERASVKYCGRRSAILTRDAQVLSSKFTRTDRRFMNPGFVTDKSVRQRRVAPDLQLTVNEQSPPLSWLRITETVELRSLYPSNTHRNAL